MSDNVILPGTGQPVSTDDIGGVQVQRVKLQQGADGTAADIHDGNPLATKLSGGSVTPGDALANPSGVGQVAALGMEWDPHGASPTSGRWRRGEARAGWFRTEVIDTAARTTTISSPILTQHGASAMAITLLATARPNTAAADLVVQLRPTSPGPEDTWTLAQFTVPDGNGAVTRRLIVSPADTLTPLSSDTTHSRAPVPRRFAVRVNNTDGATWTTTVYIHLLD